MNVSAIGNIFAPKAETAGTLAHKPAETAGILAFGKPETAGSLANNAGGSFSAMAQAKFSSIEKIIRTTTQPGWIMNEVKLTNYALMAVMLLAMATFCVSINALNQSSKKKKKQVTTVNAVY